MTGKELRQRREAAGISGDRLASAAGWAHRARVSQIEALAAVPEGSATRYIAALERLTVRVA